MFGMRVTGFMFIQPIHEEDIMQYICGVNNVKLYGIHISIRLLKENAEYIATNGQPMPAVIGACSREIL